MSRVAMLLEEVLPVTQAQEIGLPATVLQIPAPIVTEGIVVVSY